MDSSGPLPRAPSAHPHSTCPSRTSTSCPALIVATLTSLLLLGPASATPSPRRHGSALGRKSRRPFAQCASTPQLCLTPPWPPSRPRPQPSPQPSLLSLPSPPRMSPKLSSSPPPTPSHMPSRVHLAERRHERRAAKRASAPTPLAVPEHQHVSNTPRALSPGNELTPKTEQDPSSSSSVRSSNMSPVEKALSAVLGVLLLLALVGIGVCCMRKRSRARALSQTLPRTQTQPLQQPASIPLHQPPETPSSLSSFTRISPAAPEMSAVLAPGRAASARTGTAATAGFNIARFFAKQSSSGSAARGGRSVYLHNVQDYSLQKTPSATPSTRSSSNDYWDLSHSKKERTKDGFPVITLTSPTNSESSIPMSLMETPQISFLYSAEPSPSSASLSAVASSSSAAPPLHSEGTRVDPLHAHFASSPSPPSSSSSSSPASPPTLSLPTIQLPEQGSSSSSQHIGGHRQNFYLLQQQQSVPQHMLLHPSYTYSRPLQLENQASMRPTPTSLTLADFPPTYEEAIDGAGPSNSVRPRSEAASSMSPILQHSSPGTSRSALSVPESNPSAAGQPHCSSFSDVPLYDIPPWREGGLERDHWDPDPGAGVDVELDPLASLSLLPNISADLQDST